MRVSRSGGPGRRGALALVLAAAVALAPGCRAHPFGGPGGLREDLPVSAAAFDVGMVVGGTPVAFALYPLTLLLASGLQGWDAIDVVTAPALPTGMVVGLLFAAPCLLLDAVGLGDRRARPAAPSPPRASEGGRARAAAPGPSAAPGAACGPRCCAAGAGPPVCYCDWPSPGSAPRGVEATRPCTSRGEEGP